MLHIVLKIARCIYHFPYDVFEIKSPPGIVIQYQLRRRVRG